MIRPGVLRYDFDTPQPGMVLGNQYDVDVLSPSGERRECDAELVSRRTTLATGVVRLTLQQRSDWRPVQGPTEGTD